MNRRAALAGALCLFAIGLGVYVLTLRTERDTAQTEAQEARQDAATWKAAAQSGEAAVRELAAAKATAEAAAAERDATIKALTRDRDEQRRKLREAMRHDEEAGDWGSTPLPPAVLGLFR